MLALGAAMKTRAAIKGEGTRFTIMVVKLLFLAILARLNSLASITRI